MAARGDLLTSDVERQGLIKQSPRDGEFTAVELLCLENKP
jgi:hypothetical protein